MDNLTTWSRFSTFVFLGEGGSGKTELSVNLALQLAGCAQKPVHFFDMDQTKPLYRSRDAAHMLEDRGIAPHFAHELLDVPVVPPGVGEILGDPDKISVVDVGGNLMGARMMGQFGQHLRAPQAVVFYVINFYRPLATGAKAIKAVMDQVLQASGVERVRIIANPNLGAVTTGQDVRAGLEQTTQMLAHLGLTWDMAAVQQKLLPLGPPLTERSCLPIRQYFAH